MNENSNKNGVPASTEQDSRKPAVAKRVKSCGVLVFRREPELSFLLMKHPRRFDLPKGHIEEGESELDCALRELLEETGIGRGDISIEDGFVFRETYYPKYKRFGGKRVEKTLVIFMGWLVARTEIAPTEHADFQWVPWSPPHEIQRNTIDPLLAEVERFFAQS